MTLKIKCTYVADGEPFTLGKVYEIFVRDEGEFYIKTDDGIKTRYLHDSSTLPLEDFLHELNERWDSHFAVCNQPEPKREPEKDIKKEVYELLDKATELIYNNQEELKIDYMDFITLFKIKDEVKK